MPPNRDISRLSVLHIEDDPVDARVFETVLGNIYYYDFLLTHVCTLEQALTALSENTFDIVFLDLSLPDSTGLESIRQIHDISPESPVVILSGSQDPDITLKAVEWGAQDYLVKGRIDESLLTRTVRFALDRKRMELKLEYLSKYDSLSGLANRGLFYDRLCQAMIRAERRRELIALLFVDLDFFKFVNDEYGHAIGDLLLKQVAERLQASVRKDDTVARMGGDEFTVILEGISDREFISTITEKLLNNLAKPYMLDGHRITITASIGIMPYDGQGGMTPDEFLRSSDLAMYRAKKKGRNHYYYVENKADLKPSKTLNLEKKLAGALKNEEFFLVYQPQVDIKHRVVVGAEALLRWDQPEMGVVCPSSFIPLLESMNHLHVVGEWVLRCACQQWAEWQCVGKIPETALLSVNLSSRQFRHGNLVSLVEKQLVESGLRPSCLVLEITENVLLENSEVNIETLKRLKDLGVGLAVDDFGTGFSTLNYLKYFPVDCLKLDRSFVSDILNNKTDEVIAASIIRLAQDLGLKVVVEGVDSLEKVKRLQQYGCRIFQGYYFSMPLTAESFSSELLESIV